MEKEWSQPTRTVTVLIGVEDRALREDLVHALAELPHIEVVGITEDGMEAAQAAVQLRPDVAILADEMPLMTGLQAAEIISLGVPSVRTIILGGGEDVSSLREAMNCGARDRLPGRTDISTVVETVERLAALEDRRTTPEFAAVLDPRTLPRVILVTGPKGGVGKTTIAVNLAVALNELSDGRVVLVDLYTQFGDVATMLNLVPNHTLAELSYICPQFDADLVENHTVRHGSGVSVLVAAVDPLPADAISEECTETVINLLKRLYRYIVIDAPPNLNGSTTAAMSRCSYFLLIANLQDVTAVTDAKRFTRAVVGKYISSDRLRMVFNRVSKANPLPAAEVRKLFPYAVAAEIPNDDRVAYAANQGAPVVQALPKSPASLSIKALAESIIRAGEQIRATPDARGRTTGAEQDADTKFART